jgi:hypothetical protein
MQKFILTVEVTVNTAETVSAAEVKKVVQRLLDFFDGGPAEVESCKEI